MGVNTLNSRIKLLREELLKLSQADFAEMLNLKRNSISLIEVGKRNPSDRTILDICQKFNVSESWLRNGTGNVFIKTPSSTMKKLKEEFHLDDFTCSFVYEYLKLNEEKRNAVQDFFYNVLNRMEAIDHQESEEAAAMEPTKATKKLPLTESDIPKEIEKYRAALELEVSQAEKLSALPKDA